MLDIYFLEEYPLKMTATLICATPLAPAHRAGELPPQTRYVRAGELPPQTRYVRGLLLVGAAIVLGFFS